MTQPYLTDEEIEDITKPLTQGAARIKYFRSLGVKCEPKPNGQPLVGRAEFEESRRSFHVEQSGTPSATVIDFTNLKNRLRYAGGKKTQGR